MQYGVIEVTLRQVHDLLAQNLRGAIADDEALSRMRGYVSRPSVEDALQRSSDTLFAFALRALRHVASETSESSRATIKRLRECMEPELTRALGRKQNTRALWIKKPPAR
jgi:hypothetical protein